MSMSLRLSAALLSVVIATAASAQTTKVIPKGWYLHDDLAPSLDLAFYEPTQHVSFSVTCTKGYTDTIVAFMPDPKGPDPKGPEAKGPETKGPDGKTPMKLVLSRGAASVSLDATGQMFKGRYVIDGQTTMTPVLADLLQGGFTLTAGGKEIKTYATTDQDRAHVQKLTQACRS
jgi:hypothetical protein